MATSNEVIEVRELPVEEQTEIISRIDQAKKAAEIKTDADLEWAGHFQMEIKAQIKKVEEFFRPDIDRAHQIHKSLCTKLKGFTDPLNQALAITSPAIGAFIRKRQAEETAAQEKAAKQAEKKGLPPPPPAGGTFQPPKGITATTRWEAEVIDPMALVKAVAAKKVPIVAIEPNMKFLNQQATSLKELLDFPGVKAKELTGTQTRTGGR